MILVYSTASCYCVVFAQNYANTTEKHVYYIKKIFTALQDYYTIQHYYSLYKIKVSAKFQDLTRVLTCAVFTCTVVTQEPHVASKPSLILSVTEV